MPEVCANENGGIRDEARFEATPPYIGHAGSHHSRCVYGTRILDDAR